jgi:hypothetical protein
MKTSTDRILTTHTGSLPRPKPLIDLVINRERGAAIDAAAFAAETAKSGIGSAASSRTRAPPRRAATS